MNENHGPDGKFTSADGMSSLKSAAMGKQRDEWTKKTDALASGKSRATFNGATIRQDNRGDGYFYAEGRVKMGDIKSTQSFRDRSVVNDYKNQFSKALAAGRAIKAEVVLTPQRGSFRLEDGNHRFTALKELGYKGPVQARIRIE